MAIKNKTVDLNNHLFEQLERLNDESLRGEELKEEVMRSTAMTHISKQIIDNDRLQLEVAKTVIEYNRENIKELIPNNLIEYAKK